MRASLPWSHGWMTPRMLPGPKPTHGCRTLRPFWPSEGQGPPIWSPNQCHSPARIRNVLADYSARSLASLPCSLALVWSSVVPILQPLAAVMPRKADAAFADDVPDTHCKKGASVGLVSPIFHPLELGLHIAPQNGMREWLSPLLCGRAGGLTSKGASFHTGRVAIDPAERHL